MYKVIDMQDEINKNFSLYSSLSGFSVYFLCVFCYGMEDYLKNVCVAKKWNATYKI